MSKRKDMDLMMDPEGEIGSTPPWLLDKSIDTRVFCEEFLEENPMLCINNQFFNVDGLIADENSIKKKIYEKLKPWFAAGLPNKTTPFWTVCGSNAIRRRFRYSRTESMWETGRIS